MFKADIDRIKKALLELNEFNATPDFGTTRVLFTTQELAGREYIKNLMSATGLSVTEDAVGNIFATLMGSDESLAPVWTGSHCDTVLNAGMFDGMAGVIGGIEALRIIKDSGIPHKRNITVVMYTSEEPTRFGLSCLGSRALAGTLSLQGTKEIFDKEGKSLYDVLNDLGYNLQEFDKIKKEKSQVFAAIEMHIEQSSSLEENGKDIGIVKTICAPANFEVSVYGTQSHAGGTSMSNRVDALTASCELILELEKLAQQSKGEYVTATVGKAELIPNAMNVIPGLVKFTMDIRYTDIDSLNLIVEGIKAKMNATEKKRGVRIEMSELNRDIPAQSDSTIYSLIESKCKEYNYSYKPCISGAYHDSLMVNLFAPTAMIFVPSLKGISHSPEEWTDFEDIVKGTNILAEVLLETANK